MASLQKDPFRKNESFLSLGNKKAKSREEHCSHQKTIFFTFVGESAKFFFINRVRGQKLRPSIIDTLFTFCNIYEGGTK